MANNDKKPKDFFSLDKIPVSLTYLFTDPPTQITFFCKIALSADDEKARQAFYSQPSGEQEKGLHAYYVDLLARVTAAAPEGLPGFDEVRGGRAVEPGTDNLDAIRDALRAFLAEPTDLKRKVVADAIELYNRIAQPVEFFR